MSKFNHPTIPPPATSLVNSPEQPAGITHEGGAGYARDAKSELYLLAVSAMITETRFYDRHEPSQDAPRVTAHRQAGTTRVSPYMTGIQWQQETVTEQRFRELTRTCALEDLHWMTGFARWLRRDAFMRTATIVAAAETIQARHTAGTRPNGRAIIPAALDRGDEPGELLGYWLTRYGRRLPHPLTRGLADAVQRLYSEYTVCKYDTPDKPIRFGDVIELCQPRYNRRLYGTWRDDLYRYCIGRRHNRRNPVPDRLTTIRRHRELMSMPLEQRRDFLTQPDAASILSAAGVTWESLSAWLHGPMDKQAWTMIAPSMGVHALLKNLRNFDQAGITDEAAAQIAAALSDPQRVTKAKMFPMRFLAAQRAMISQRWGHALDNGLDATVGNIPWLPGRTLILVDTSSSMDDAFSRDGTLRRWDAAAVFAIAIARRCENTNVVSFSSSARYWGDQGNANTKTFPRIPGESLLRSLDRWRNGGYFLGGGTDTAGAVRACFRPGYHTRVIILTDEQCERSGPEVSASISPAVPLYTWNLAGYRHGHTPSGRSNRHTFGGLSDTSFRLIHLLETGRDAQWDDLFQQANL